MIHGLGEDNLNLVSHHIGDGDLWVLDQAGLLHVGEVEVVLVLDVRGCIVAAEQRKVELFGEGFVETGYGGRVGRGGGGGSQQVLHQLMQNGLRYLQLENDTELFRHDWTFR